MEQKSTFWKSAMNYGLYLALISIVLSLIIWATSLMENIGLWGSMIIGLLNLLIAVIFLIIVTKAYRNNVLNGQITFGKAFSLGVMVVIFSTIITGLYSYIFNRFIDPTYMERVITAIKDSTYQWMAGKGIPEDQISATLDKIDQKGIPTPIETLVQSIKGGLIGGTIMSVLSSLIVKKNINKDAFDEAMEEIKPEE